MKNLKMESLFTIFYSTEYQSKRFYSTFLLKKYVLSKTREITANNKLVVRT